MMPTAIMINPNIILSPFTSREKPETGWFLVLFAHNLRRVRNIYFQHTHVSQDAVGVFNDRRDPAGNFLQRFGVFTESFNLDCHCLDIVFLCPFYLLMMRSLVQEPP